MRKLAEKNLKSISFPALGAGGYGYPSGLVATVLLQEIINFLVLFKKNSFIVNLVVHDKDTEIIKVILK